MTMEHSHEVIHDLLQRDALSELKAIITSAHPADLASTLMALESDDRRVFFELIENQDKRADALAQMDHSVAKTLLENMEYLQASQLLRRMDNDDAADILGLFPENVTQEILKLLEESQGAEGTSDIAELLQYRKDSAGGVMNSEVFSLREDQTIAEALRAVQQTDENIAIAYIYVVNAKGELTGLMPWKQLLRNRPDRLLRDVMNRKTISVNVDMDQEEVARIVKQYDLVAVPVVDASGVLVGMVTVDDVIDVIIEEATEDILALGGVSESDLNQDSVVLQSRNRIPWLFASCLGGLVASKVISHYSLQMGKMLSFAAFIPVVIGMAGNVGTQSATLMIRGLALNKIELNSMGRVLFRELRIGIILGAVYGLIVGGMASVGHMETIHVGLIVGLSVLCNMCVASVFGTCVPLLFYRFKIDPAVSSGPFVTTALDIIGMLVYCNIIYFLAT